MYKQSISKRKGYAQFASSVSLLLLLAGCGGGGSGSGGTPGTPLTPAAALGKQVFFDTALSVSGQQSCGTCHVPSHAFANADDLPVQPGGPNMELTGLRNTPSLMYASYTPAFHFEADGTPVGGFMRDGRNASLAIQAQGPFVTSFEMANSGPDEVVQRLKTRPYLQQFIDLYGAETLNDSQATLRDLGAALAAFEREDSAFHPFTSKYDYRRTGQAQLTAQELNGLRLFNDPTRGNCAACHSSVSADGVTPPLFTDFSYDNLGVPRNAAIAANDDSTTLPYVPNNGSDGVHNYYDAGLCGPLRTDLGGNTAALCGAFKVPSLRDVALTAPYFHNGAFATLQEAVSFYVTRDTDPAHWYPADPQGNIIKYDDLEARYGGRFVVNSGMPGSDAGYVGNVNTSEIPYNRKLGDAPALSQDEVTDIVAFLCTLTDGYDPAHPDSYALPAQCPQSSSNH